MEPNIPNKKAPSTSSKISKKTKMKEEFKELNRRKSSFKMELENYLKSTPNPISENLKIRSLSNYKPPKLTLEPESANTSFQSSKLNRPVVIGITGGSGSGKSLMCETIKRQIRKLGLKCSRVKEKNFLKAIDLEEDNEEMRFKYLKNYDFDCMNAVDWDLFKKCVHHLEQRKPFNTPIYDLFKQKRILRTKRIKPADLIIVEGRLLFNIKELREKCDVKIFLDTDSDIMLSRRVFHNIARGRDLKEIIKR